MAGMFGKLLHGRGGESLVEVLVAIVVFLVLMGTLCAGTRFASGALMRAETIRDSVVQFQESLRRNLAEGNMTDGGAGVLHFGGGRVAVPVRFLSVQAMAREAVYQKADGGSPAYEEKVTTFYLFAAQEGGDGS